MKLIDEHQLPRLIAAATGLGCLTTLVNTGLVEAFLDKETAFELYGQVQVRQWLDDGSINFMTEGNLEAERLDRLELETLSAAYEVANCFRKPVLPDPNSLPN